MNMIDYVTTNTTDKNVARIILKFAKHYDVDDTANNTLAYNAAVDSIVNWVDGGDDWDNLENYMVVLKAVAAMLRTKVTTTATVSIDIVETITDDATPAPSVAPLLAIFLEQYPDTTVFGSDYFYTGEAMEAVCAITGKLCKCAIVSAFYNPHL